MTHEQLRRQYRPEQVRLLFIGESPPASGRFFYARNSGLYRAMLEVFKSVDPGIRDETFLDVFQASGCYLVDLCPQPVDHLDRHQRRATCAASEELLAKEILVLGPLMIATLLRSIEPNVARAVTLACWKGQTIHLPYPGRWERLRVQFAERLRPAIGAILDNLQTTSRPQTFSRHG